MTRHKLALVPPSVELSRTAGHMNTNNSMNINNKKIVKLSEVDQELVGLVAVGLTDDEIATQLQIPQLEVVNRIARLLVKLGAQDRVEIVLYAFSDPMMRQRISSGVIHRIPKKNQAQNPGVNRKVS